MAKKRNIMEIKVSRTGDGESASYGATYMLPMGDATAADAETCAGFMMKGVNAQLDYCKSDLRLGVFNCKTGERLYLKEKE
jgi:hypothetical protein